jgi:hypothetical protein
MTELRSASVAKCVTLIFTGAVALAASDFIEAVAVNVSPED